ncbi:MAG TPA: hypothetical protein VGI78_12530 [Acetobacteraceae bacterium]
MTGRGAWWAVLASVSAALLAPLLIVDVPPVLDYPNHLARFVLLAAGPDDPVLGHLFTPHWAIIPDLVADLIGPPLLRLLPVHVAGRCVLGGILLLNLAGVVALHRAWFGRRSFWPLASGLVAYNSGFLLGFLNWQIGSGLAMLFAAAWLTWRERRPVATIAGAAAASVVLFFCHLMGLMFFLVLIGSAEAHALWRGRAVLSRASALLPVLAGPLLLWPLTPLHRASAAMHWMSPHEKLVQMASPFVNYIFPLDIVSAVLVYGGVALGVAAGWLALAPRAMAAVAVLAVLYVALPFDLMSGAFLDTRVAVMLGFLVFAAVDPVRVPKQTSRAVAAGLAVLFAVRMAVVAEVWAEHRRDLADLRAVIAAVPPGALVYMTSVPQQESPEYWDAGPRSRRLSNGLRADFHLPALLLIERGAFWPILFANPAQQPIRLRPEYARLAREAHDIPSHAALVLDPAHGSAALRDFDFVLMLEAGADADLAGFVPQCLDLVSSTDFAALFRVRREALACRS